MIYSNRNIEYFNNPKYTTLYTPSRKKSHNNSKTLYEYNNKKLYNSLNEDNYDVKTKKNLQKLDCIKSLEIKGENLLNFEEKRETNIKGKKILYNKQEFELLHFKQNVKTKNKKYKKEKEKEINIDDIYKDKTFAKNYDEKDFFKNTNLMSKCSNLNTVICNHIK